MMTITTRNIYNKNNLIALGLAIICTYLLFPSMFVYQLGPLSPEDYFGGGLDRSWATTLNYAVMNDLTWGKDISFTYGPLGYLGIRVGWGVSRYSFILYDLFYFSNLFAVFYLSYKQSANKLLAALLIIIVTLMVPPNIGGANALVLLFFLIFWIKQNFENPRHLHYIIQVLLIVVLFYTKFNTVFISLIFFYTSLIYLVFFKKEKILWPLVYAILPIVLIVAFASVLHVDLPGYITTGFEFVAGYNQIMYLTDPTLTYMLWLVMLLAVLIAVFFAIRLYSEKKLFFKNLIILFLFSASFFILYKQAFLRGDVWHILEFFKFAPLLLLCTSYFTDHSFKNKMSFLVVVILGISSVTYFTLVETDPLKLNAKLDKSAYYNQFKDFEPNQGMYMTPPHAPLPEKIRQKIGQYSTDVYPNTNYMLYENSINYLPRPAMQAYAAYTKNLAKLDFEHYNSDRGPKFVIYDNEGIDNRYSMFDEARMHLVLQKNYTVTDTFSHCGHKLILLEKKRDTKPVELKFLREYAMLSTSPVVPKKDIYYEVTFYSTFNSKIKSILNHTPEINLAIQTMDGAISEYRTSPALLESGLFSTVKVSGTYELLEIMNDTKVGNDRQVKQYLFRPAAHGSYKEKIRIKEYQIN